MEKSGLTDEVVVYLTDEHFDKPPYKAFAEIFKRYKSGEHIRCFGRDEPYTYPDDVVAAGIWHLHVLTNKEIREQIKRPPENRVSDHIVIYAKNYENPNAYLILAIVNPGGHVKQRDTTYLKQLAYDASEFYASLQLEDELSSELAVEAAK